MEHERTIDSSNPSARSPFLRMLVDVFLYGAPPPPSGYLQSKAGPDGGESTASKLTP